MNWYKLAQFTEENIEGTDSPNVVIEPVEPIVQEVVNELKTESPNIFQGVRKIKIDMGYGQFGSVSSEDPSDINLNFNRIKSQLSQEFGTSFDINDPNQKQRLKNMIKETIIHEKGHVSDAWSAHQKTPGIGGAKLFPGGENVAEQNVRKMMPNLTSKSKINIK